MKIVGLKKTPPKLFCQHFAHGCFASARNSENDYHHGPLIFLRLTIFSTTKAIRHHKVCHVERSRNISRNHNSTVTLQKKLEIPRLRSE
jgi:hypothetical protein